MATIYWAGTTGDWQTAGNWSGAAVPTDDDIVIFDGRVSQAVTDGTDYSETGATGDGALDLLHFKSSWAGGMAAADQPLCIHADKIIIEGSGTYHICIGKDDQDTDADVDCIIVNNEDAVVYLYSLCNDATKTCKVTNLLLKAGTVYLAYFDGTSVYDEAGQLNGAGESQGCFAQNIYVLPEDNKDTAVTLTIEKDAYGVNGTVASNLTIKRGTVETDSMLGTVFMVGGTLTVGPNDLGASPETDVNITKLIALGGTIHWHPDDSGNDAYIGTLILAAAALYANSSTNADKTKVLGNGADADVILGEGATLNIANGRSNISLASNSELFNLGGVVETDLSRQSVESGVAIGLDVAHS